MGEEFGSVAPTAGWRQVPGVAAAPVGLVVLVVVKLVLLVADGVVALVDVEDGVVVLLVVVELPDPCVSLPST